MNIRKNYDLHIKVGSDEKAKIANKASNVGKSISQFVRDRTLNDGESSNGLEEIRTAIQSLNEAVGALIDRGNPKNTKRGKRFHDNLLYDPNKASDLYGFGSDIYGQSHREET